MSAFDAQDVLDRLDALESRGITLDDLPLADLRSKLVDTGQPLDLSVLALGQGIGYDQLNPLAWPRVTALPTNPREGDIISYVADSTNGIEWLLRYTAAEPVRKWRFLGGPPLQADILTDESTASLTYVDLATAGPSVTVPLAGDYYIDFMCRAFNATANAQGFMSPKIGSAATADNDGGTAQTAANDGIGVARVIKKTCAAADLIKAQYRVTAGTGFFQRRSLVVTPIRVS